MFTIDIPFLISSIACFFIVVLGLFVFFSDWRTKINRIFLLLVIAITGWIVTVLFRFYSIDPQIILFNARLTFSFAALIALSLYLFTYFFPTPNKKGSLVLPLVVFSGIVSIVLSLGEYTVGNIVIQDGVQVDTYSFGYYLFTVYFLATLSLSIFNLLSKYKHLDRVQRLQTQYFFIGFLISMLLGFATNVIVPYLTGITDIAKAGPASAAFFIFLASVAVLRYKLLDVKVIATEVFIYGLWLFILIRSIISENSQERIINWVLLALTVVIGLLLIRSVEREVEQRRKIEKLAGELEEANRRQESLLHFIGHEIKGYFTKSHWALSSMLDGDYGEIASDLKALTNQALDDTKSGIDMVESILKAGNLKKGTVSYDMKPFDFKGEVKNVIETLKPNIDAKKLSLEMHIDETQDYTLNGDGEQISKHVLRNLIDNAIKYTPSGTITIGLSKKDNKILFSVKDSGVGIKEEDRKLLFTEGGRGKDSVRINVHSTGYGLFIAKQIVDAHKGRIWAESKGNGRGSTFFVEI